MIMLFLMNRSKQSVQERSPAKPQVIATTQKQSQQETHNALCETLLELISCQDYTKGCNADFGVFGPWVRSFWPSSLSNKVFDCLVY